MTYLHTYEIHIEKSKRGGWSVHTIWHRNDTPNPAHTYGPSNTLAWAIYKCVDWASKNNSLVTVLTVHNKPYPREKAEAVIKKYAPRSCTPEQNILDALAIE